MGRRAKKGRPFADLEDAINKLIRETMAADSKATLTDKCKVLDRGLKFAALSTKTDDPGFGTGFGDTEED